MEPFFLQVFNLLSTAPGNLIYHLVMAFSIISPLQAVFSQPRSAGTTPLIRRIALGLMLLLVSQFILYLASGLGWQGIANPEVILPPLDRAVTAFGLIWIIWLWAFPKTRRGADAAAIVVSLLVMVGMAVSGLIWSRGEPSASFNGSNLDYGWSSFSILLLLLGTVFLLIRRTPGWEIGLGQFSLILAGQVLHILFPTIPGSFSGIIRLAQLAAYPMLLWLPQRLTLPSIAAVVTPVLAGSDDPTQPRPERRIGPERRRHSADPKTISTFLNLAIQNTATPITTALTRAMGQALLADFCFLISNPDEFDRLVIEGGYDLIREESIPGVSLESQRVPMLSGYLARGKPLRLTADHTTSSDMEALADAFKLTNPGNLLAVPITNADQVTVGGIVLLTPYSNRVWSSDDQAYLTSLTIQVAQILLQTRQALMLQNETNHLRLELEEIRNQASQYQRELMVVQQEVQNPLEQINALQSVNQEMQLMIDRLQSENEQLRKSGVARMALLTSGRDPQESQHMENELRMALTEVAELKNALAAANIQMLRYQHTEQQTSLPPVIEEVPEIQQGLQSILKQVDLLSRGKSPDPARAIEEIRANAEKMTMLLDDLLPSGTVPLGDLEQGLKKVNLNEVIDAALFQIGSQMREKNINLRIDLPRQEINLYTDANALQQAVLCLLQNAGTVTPVEGTIRLTVRSSGKDPLMQFMAAQVQQAETFVREQNEAFITAASQKSPAQQFLVIQVTDGGCGIASNDLGRLFVSGQEDKPIQGVGNQESLALAHTLVEAQNGRLWAVSKPGKNATFCIMLPLIKPFAGNH